MRILFFLILLSYTVSFSQEGGSPAEKEKKEENNRTSVNKIGTEINKRHYVLLSHNPVRLLNFPSAQVLVNLDDTYSVGAEFRYVRSGDKLRGWGVAPTVRAYPFHQGMTGFYIEGFTGIHAIDDGIESETLYTFGALPGWQFAIKKKLAVGIGFGVEYFLSNQLLSSPNTSERTTSLNPYFRLDIGWIF
ncbi:MAG: hypothetical protein Kapaf2KO_16430 [Candidatus Kapaibacteriales bacterium]